MLMLTCAACILVMTVLPKLDGGNEGCIIHARLQYAWYAYLHHRIALNECPCFHQVVCAKTKETANNTRKPPADPLCSQGVIPGQNYV